MRDLRIAEIPPKRSERPLSAPHVSRRHAASGQDERQDLGCGVTFPKRQNNYMTAAEADVGHVTALGACSDASNAFHTAPPASPFGKPDAALDEKHMRSIAI